MTRFLHERHKPPRQLQRPRELVLACPPLRSNVNLARIVRVAGCFAVNRLIVCGRPPKIDRQIARQAVDQVRIENRRTLSPVLRQLREQGYRLVGLEQTTQSQILYEYPFPRQSVLVFGNERLGLGEEVLELLDDAVEIPVYGLPYSLNVASAVTMALYEYCRQFPDG